MPEKVIVNPANVAPKLKIAEAVAGVAGGRPDRCFPPRAEVIINVIKTGNHAIRSYL